MKTQLIVTILGSDRSGILSEIATTVNDANCNILDSRQAIYGKDFSLTMIIEGNTPAIALAESLLPALCQRNDLLSMMKRTSQHEKLNLELLFDVEFSGEDAVGLLRSVTGFFAEREATISAFRQKTYLDDVTNKQNMKCKMVISVSKNIDVSEFEASLLALFASLNLQGQLKDTHTKDHDEHASSWR